MHVSNWGTVTWFFSARNKKTRSISLSERFDCLDKKLEEVLGVFVSEVADVGGTDN